MQITVLESNPAHASFLISKAGDEGTAYLNGVRRAIISQLESFAIEDVTVYENNSALFNEYITHRLGLIPLTYEESMAADAAVEFSLMAEGPCTVYSRDLKTADEKIHVFSQNIPIAVLGLDQKLRLEATAVRGIAKTHAKFQCAHASFAQLCELTVAKKVDEDDVVQAYAATSEKPEEFAKKHPELCDFNLEHVKIGDTVYKVDCKEDEFLFYVESYNNIPAQKQFERAVEMVKSKLVELSKELK
jgi:DNA-directed RNA polymerase subunit D